VLSDAAIGIDFDFDFDSIVVFLVFFNSQDRHARVVKKDLLGIAQSLANEAKRMFAANLNPARLNRG